MFNGMVESQQTYTEEYSQKIADLEFPLAQLLALDYQLSLSSGLPS